MRKWLDFLSTIWLGLITHKLRSFLTILGIVIGVAAVISLMAIGRGTAATIVSNIESLGANLVIIRPGFTSQGGVRSGFGSASTLTMGDAAAISTDVPYITAVAPYYSASLQVVAGSQNLRGQINGVTADYQQVFNLQTVEGDFITEYDYQSANKVAVIGPNVKDTLFPDSDPLGQQMRMGNIIVYVGGVLQSKGASMLGSTDDSILVPMTVLQQAVAQPMSSRGERVVSSIALSVTDQNQTTYVINEITADLRSRHQLAATADNDFSVTSTEELANTVASAMSSMTMLLAAIAAIALLVGGIGVMNIMLVSVLERTREIGIRKALGAGERDIWTQFLIEAAFLTFTGGIIGVIVGWIVAMVISRLGLVNTVVSPDIVILAVSVSVGIGLFFGFYPAWNASRLNPIEALRSE